MSESPSKGEGGSNIEGVTETPVIKKPRSLLFIFILIGICLGSLALVPRIPGLFDSWDKLTAAPYKPIELLGASSFWSGPGNVYILADDGQVYLLKMSNGQWSKAVQGYEIVSTACNLSTLKFSSWKRPFKEPFQCAQVYGHGDVAPAPLFSFVLDQDGNLWYWDQEAMLLFLCMFPLMAGVGLIAGILLNFIWLATRRVRLSRA